MEPITIPKGTAIGALEAVELVTVEDPVWKESMVAAVSRRPGAAETNSWRGKGYRKRMWYKG